MRHFPAFDDIRSITVPSATTWKLRCWPNAALLLVTKTWEENCKVSRPPLFKIIYISIFKSFHGGWRFPVDHGIPIILAVHGLWLWYPQLISPGFSTRLIRFKSKGSLRKLYTQNTKSPPALDLLSSWLVAAWASVLVRQPSGHEARNCAELWHLPSSTPQIMWDSLNHKPSTMEVCYGLWLTIYSVWLGYPKMSDANV